MSNNNAKVLKRFLSSCFFNESMLSREKRVSTGTSIVSVAHKDTLPNSVYSSLGCCSFLKSHTNYRLMIPKTKEGLTKEERDRWVEEISELFDYKIKAIKPRKTTFPKVTSYNEIVERIAWDFSKIDKFSETFLSIINSLITEMFEVTREILKTNVKDDKEPARPGRYEIGIYFVKLIRHPDKKNRTVVSITDKDELEKIIESLKLVFREEQNEHSIQNIKDSIYNLLMTSTFDGDKYKKVITKAEGDNFAFLSGFVHNDLRIPYLRNRYGSYPVIESSKKTDFFDKSDNSSYSKLITDLIEPNEVLLIGTSSVPIRDVRSDIRWELERGVEYPTGWLHRGSISPNIPLRDKFSDLVIKYGKILSKVKFTKLESLPVYEVKGNKCNALLIHTLLRYMWENPRVVRMYLEFIDKFDYVEDKYFLLNIILKGFGSSSFGSALYVSTSGTIKGCITNKSFAAIKKSRLSKGKSFRYNRGSGSVQAYYNNVLNRVMPKSFKTLPDSTIRDTGVNINKYLEKYLNQLKPKENAKND